MPPLPLSIDALHDGSSKSQTRIKSSLKTSSLGTAPLELDHFTVPVGTGIVRSVTSSVDEVDEIIKRVPCNVAMYAPSVEATEAEPGEIRKQVSKQLDNAVSFKERTSQRYRCLHSVEGASSRPG